MKKINYVKMTLDILMALTFALLFNPGVMGGLTFHETAGLAIGAAFLTHIFLNFRWVKNATLKIFNKKLPGKVRFSYLLNLLLLISMTVIIVSGVFISRVLFPNLAVGDRHTFRELHNVVSNIALVLAGLHLGLHWQWIKSIGKKVFKTKDKRPRKKAIAAAVITTLLLIGGLQFVSTSLGNNTSIPPRQQMTTGTNGQGENPFQNGQNQQANSGLNQNNGSNSTKNFQGSANGSFDRGPGHHREFDGNGSQSIVSILVTKLGLMGVIAVLTYYLEKISLRKKRKDKISTQKLAETS